MEALKSSESTASVKYQLMSAHNETLLKNGQYILNIAITVHVCSATCEQYFSSMRRLNNLLIEVACYSSCFH